MANKVKKSKKDKAPKGNQMEQVSTKEIIPKTALEEPKEAVSQEAVMAAEEKDTSAEVKIVSDVAPVKDEVPEKTSKVKDAKEPATKKTAAKKNKGKELAQSKKEIKSKATQKPATKKAEAAAKKEKGSKTEKKPEAKKLASSKESAKAKALEKVDMEVTAPAKKPGRKPMTPEEKAIAAEQRAKAKEVALKMVPTLILQHQGSERNISAVIELVKADFKSKHKRTLLTSLTVYFKPEENAAYYVANENVTGKIAI